MGVPLKFNYTRDNLLARRPDATRRLDVQRPEFALPQRVLRSVRGTAGDQADMIEMRERDDRCWSETGRHDVIKGVSSRALISRKAWSVSAGPAGDDLPEW